MAQLRRALLTLCLVAAGLTAPALPHAVACSCDSGDTREALSRADGAFVGTLLAIEELSTAERQSFPYEVRYRFRVERSVKGDIAGPEIDVYSWPGGGSCGFDGPVGRRLAMLVYREGEHWTSSLCSQEDPDVLVRAAQPLPPPDGEAPPAVLVGTTYGPGRMLSLDGKGRVVAYAGGDGAVTDIAFCPGNGAFAETYHLHPGRLGGGASFSGLAVRSAGDLAVIDQQEIDGEALGPMALADIACRDSETTDVVVFVVDDSNPGGYPDLYRGRVLSWVAHRDRLRDVWRGPAQSAVFTPGGTSVYVNAGPEGRDLLRIDLSDLDRPVAHRLVRLPAGTGPLALAPGGRHLAGAINNPPPDDVIKAVIVDLAASPVSVAEYGLGNRDSGPRYERAVWSGPDRVVFAPRWKGSEVQVFDSTLTPVASWSGWTSADAVTVVGDRLLGLMWSGSIEVAPLASGPVTRWANLAGGIPGTLVAFPGGAPIESTEPSPTSTTGTTRATETTSDGESPEAAAPGGGGESATAGPLLLAGAGVFVLAAGVAVLVRRRRGGVVPEKA